MSDNNSNNSIVSKVLDWLGFRVMTAWAGKFIHTLWNAEKTDFIDSIEADATSAAAAITNSATSAAAAIWVGTENNVNMLCDYGVSGTTYTLGEWTVTDGNDTYTSDQVDGQDMQVTYNPNVMYMGGLAV